MIRVLLSFALLCAYGNLFAQDLPQTAAVRRFQSLVLRGESAAAKREFVASSSLLEPAERALWDAALRPLAERPQAFLVVAGLYADHAHADTALCAAISHYLVARGWDPRTLDGVIDDDAEGLSDDFDQEGFLRSLRQQLTRREEKGGCAETLADTRRLLDTACVTQRIEKPVRVRPGQVVPVPTPLDAAIRVRFYHATSDTQNLYLAEPRASMVSEQMVEVGSEVDGVKVPDEGRYVMELQTLGKPWRSLRIVEVSELDVIVQRAGDAFVVGVSLGGEAEIDAEVRVVGQDLVLTDGSGIVVVPDDNRVTSIEVVAGANRSIVTIGNHWRRGGTRKGVDYLGHVVVDRPLYRRGETVKGRIMLQRVGRSELRGLADLATQSRELYPLSQKVSIRVVWPGSASFVIKGETDARGFFAFEASIPESVGLGRGRVTVSVLEPAAKAGEERRAVTVGKDTVFSIRQFRRPPIMVEVSGPNDVDLAEEFVLSVSAKLASGAPAAGLRVEAIASDDRGKRHVVTSVLDLHGMLQVPVASQCFGRGERLRIDVRITAPDGQVIERRHSVGIRSKPKSELRIEVDAGTVAGQFVRADVFGRPHEMILATMFRTVPRDVEMYQLDSDGRMSLVFGTRAEDWPSVDLIVTSPDRSVRRRIQLAHPRGVLKVEVADDQDRYGPGETVELRVHSFDSSGAAPSTVCIAIVDERVFAAASDTVRHPQRALTPYLERLAVLEARSLIPIPGIRLIGEQLWGGRVLGLPKNPSSGGGASPGPSGAAMAGGVGVLTMRSEFRSTAFFVADVKTGSKGQATVQFRLPDDLTTWRVTAYAIDAHGRGARTRSAIETGTALAVTPMLPRQVVVGDQLRIPVLIDLAAGQAAQEVKLAYSSPGESIVLEEATDHCAAVPGFARRTEFKLEARSVGPAAVEVQAHGKGLADASRRELPVIADRVVRPRSVTARVKDTTGIPSPGNGSQTLVLVGRRDALLARARAALELYPYGCVEQTLSKILPYFYTARSALENGQKRDVLSPAQRRRLLSGMRRLRSLQVSSDRGFAWWPGGSADTGMSALVITGLVIARDGGFDPKRYGIEFEFGRGLAASLAQAVIKGKGRVGGEGAFASFEEAEFVVAALLFNTKRAELRRAVRLLVEAKQELPRGLLARAGRALARASQGRQAQAVFERILEGRDIRKADDRWLAFPGESAAAILAAELEMILELAPEHARRDACVLELLGGFRGGSFGSTYATATALAALSREREGASKLADNQTVRATVRMGEQCVEVELSPGNHYQQSLAVPAGSSVSIESKSGHAFFATLESATEEIGSTHPGWSQPISVSRRLLGSIGQGEITTVEIEVSSSRAVRYVVVDCPLPAGWEFVGEGGSWSVFDDRVVRTIPYLGSSEAVTLTFQIVPALVGRVRWLPATASAMYVPRCDGGSAGLVVDIKSRARLQPAPEVTTLLAGIERYKSPPEAPKPEVEDFVGWLENFPASYDKGLGFHPGAIVTHCLQRALTPRWLAGIVTGDAEKSVDREAWSQFLAAFLDDMRRGPTEYHFDVLEDLYFARESKLYRGSARSADRRWLEQASHECMVAGIEILVTGLSSEDRSARDCAAGLLCREAFILNALQDRKQRDAAFRHLLIWVKAHQDRWPDPEDWESVVEDAYPKETADTELQTLSLTLFARDKSELRWRAFLALPESMRVELPAKMLDSVTDWFDEEDYVRYLQKTERGRRHLLQSMQKDSWCDEFADAAASSLSPEQWRQASLRFFDYVILEEQPGIDLLARSAHSNTALLAEYQRAETEEFAQAILRALQKRGVAQLETWPELDAASREDDTVPKRRELADAYLAACAGDFDASLVLREMLFCFRNDHDDAILDDVPAFEEIALAGLLGHFTEREFLLEYDSLNENQQRSVLRRLGVERTLAILRRSADPKSWGELDLEVIPFLGDRRVRDLIWSQRSELAENNADLITALSGTLAHALELRQRIESIPNLESRYEHARSFVSITDLPVPMFGIDGRVGNRLRRYGLASNRLELSSSETKSLRRRGLPLR